MLRSLLALVALGAPLVAAQTPPPAAASPAQETAPAAGEVLHRFQIVDGAVHLDGIEVPGAVPASLDLRGLSTPPMEFVGPVSPVVEVDGQAFVFEGGRLVPFADSPRADQRGVFLMADLVPEPEPVAEATDDALALVSEEMYMRDVAGRDRGLYEKLHLERTLELDATRLADQVRSSPPGAGRDRLRSDLRDLLSRLLTLKQQIRRQEVARAQAELDSLRAAIDHRDAHHEAMVDARLRELCGE